MIAMPSAAALTGVPETMLWTLHNRAREAMRPDGRLFDPHAIRIYRSIDYDYERHFGPPDGSHAWRAVLYDWALRRWLAEHPTGTVIELGAGLETQLFRCDNGRLRWVAVDVPEAMAVRARFIDHPRCTHLADSALSLSWLGEVAPTADVFVSAQGLLMYFTRQQAAALIEATLTHFSRATIVFDVVPRWFSALSRWGLRKTRHYRAPVMPWGMDRGEIPRTVERWSPRPVRVAVRPYGPARGLSGAAFGLASRIPGLGNYGGHVVEVVDDRPVPS